jgi:hypothetical protein
MNDIQGQYVLAGTIDYIFLEEFLGDKVLVIDEEGIELRSHGFRSFMERNRFRDIFCREDEGLADCYPTDHYFIVVLVFLCEFFELQVTVGQVHDILKPFLAYRSKIFWSLEL